MTTSKTNNRGYWQNWCSRCYSTQNLELHHINYQQNGHSEETDILCRNCHSAMTTINEFYRNIYGTVFRHRPEKDAEIRSVRKFLYLKFIQTNPRRHTFQGVDTSKRWVKMKLLQYKNISS